MKGQMKNADISTGALTEADSHFGLEEILMLL